MGVLGGKYTSRVNNGNDIANNHSGIHTNATSETRVVQEDG